MDAQAHITVSGTVQGVGFRFSVTRLARMLRIEGWAKNRSDGRVEIEVEGEKGLIQSFIKDLKTHNPYARVHGIEVEWLPYSGKYTGFDIRH